MSANELVCSSLDNKASGFTNDLLQNSNAKCSTKDEKISGNCMTMGKGVKSTRSVSVPCEKWSGDTLDQEDNEEYPVDVMTGSYGEICFDQSVPDLLQCASQSSKSKADYATPNGVPSQSTTVAEEKQNEEHCEVETRKDKKRPNSLILQKSLLSVGVQTDEQESRTASDQPEAPLSFQTTDSQKTSIDGSPSLSSEELLLSYGHRRTGSDTSGLMELQGMLAFEGDMVTFVADDLQEKIKMSSPVSKRGDTPSFPGSRSSTPSLYRHALQPQVPLIDAAAICDLESQAHRVATRLDTLLGNLSGTLHSISSLTVDCIDTQEEAVCKTCDSIDSNIKVRFNLTTDLKKSMYQLMAKCEELSNSMQPIYKIAEDIKEIKRLLELFERAVENRS